MQPPLGRLEGHRANGTEPASSRLRRAATLTILLLYTGVVLVGGLVRLPSSGSLAMNDKAGHFLVFAGMTLLAVFASRAWAPRQTRGKSLGVAAAYGVIVGGGVEALQSLVPYRSAEWLDWAADAAGALLAVGIAAGLFVLGAVRRRT